MMDIKETLVMIMTMLAVMAVIVPAASVLAVFTLWIARLLATWLGLDMGPLDIELVN